MLNDILQIGIMSNRGGIEPWQRFALSKLFLFIIVIYFANLCCPDIVVTIIISFHGNGRILSLIVM